MGSGAENFFCVRVEVRAEGARGDEAVLQELSGWVSSECFGAGALGVEERNEPGCVVLLIYAERSRLEEVLAAASSAGGVAIGEPLPIETLDWSEQWKEGLSALEVSNKLVVRPSFVEFELQEGQREIVIDPGQAFGTGGHASTSLILEWLDVLSPEFRETTRVLDIGSGTGVLAMAALALGAGRAVGFDLDPRAGVEARVWAENNGLADRLMLFTGGIEALDAEPFDLVVANLLSSEVLPIVPQLVEQIGPGGGALLSGLLAEEQPRIEAAFASHGFQTQGARFLLDATGDHWVSLHMGRA